MPNWNHIVRERLAVLRLSPERESEIVEEIALHLEATYDAARADGFSDAEAQARALQSYDWQLLECELSRVERPLRFTPPELNVTGGSVMEPLLQDLRFGARMLVKHPGFTIIAVLTLALGIGANTAIFSVVNAVLLRPLPFVEPHNVMLLWTTNPTRNVAQEDVSPDDYLDWQRGAQSFSEMAAWAPFGFNITGEAEPEKISSVLVTPNLFPLLGVNAAVGRTFLPEEATGNANVVLLSHGLWQRRYGGDRNLIGRTLWLDGKSFTVVGVMPPEFRFPNREVEMWAPLNPAPGDGSRRNRWFKVAARLKPGVTPDQARSELQSVAAQLSQQHADTNAGWSADLAPLGEVAVKEVRRGLWLLLAAVGFVLLIACVNVANLFLSQVDARQKELAIRAALGAGRFALLRQLLIESGLLALLGGAGGLLLAWWGRRLLLFMLPSDAVAGPDELGLLRFDQVALDGRVLGFTLLVALLTSVVFGLAPAWQAARTNLQHALKEGGRNVAGRSRLRSGLLIAEVALTLILLVGAGLLLRSFARLMDVPPGFNAERLLVFRLSPSSKYPRPADRLNFYQQLNERLRQLPGVEAVGASTSLPFTGVEFNIPFSIEGRADVQSGERQTAKFHSITPDYFRALSIPLIAGRLFTEQDTGDKPGVALVNQAFAQRYWPNESPVGQRLKSRFTGNDPIEVVGVVGDTRQNSLDTNIRPEFFVPHTQRPWAFMSFALRTSGDPLALAAAARQQVWAIDRDVPVYGLATVEARIAESVAQRRFNLWLLGLFAGLALLLAAVGIYGVMRYAVSQRTHEIGLRMALGAARRDVLQMILRQGVTLASCGVGLGLLGAVVLTHWMQSLLFGVSATDPLTFMVVALLLVGVAALACWLPARRATKVDPLVALRHE